jgi:hypothetical protein
MLIVPAFSCNHNYMSYLFWLFFSKWGCLLLFNFFAFFYIHNYCIDDLNVKWLWLSSSCQSFVLFPVITILLLIPFCDLNRKWGLLPFSVEVTKRDNDYNFDFRKSRKDSHELFNCSRFFP